MEAAVASQLAKSASGPAFFLSAQKVICLETYWETVNRSLAPRNWSMEDKPSDQINEYI